MGKKEWMLELVQSITSEEIKAQVPQKLLPWTKCSKRKIQNAIDSYARTARAEEVVAMEDATLLGSGKEGILLTTEAMYSSQAGWPADLRFYDLDYVGITGDNTLVFHYLSGKIERVISSSYNRWMLWAINLILVGAYRRPKKRTPVPPAPPEDLVAPAPGTTCGERERKIAAWELQEVTASPGDSVWLTMPAELRGKSADPDAAEKYEAKKKLWKQIWEIWLLRSRPDARISHDHGVRSKLRDNDREALLSYQAAATYGDSVSQFEYAEMLLKGKGVSELMKERGFEPLQIEAYTWIQRAAMQDHSGACKMLQDFRATDRGRVVMRMVAKQRAADQKQFYELLEQYQQDGLTPTEQLEWFEDLLRLFQARKYVRLQCYEIPLRDYQTLANMGYAAAQLELGYMYAHGMGTRTDWEKALQYCTMAAEQNYADAQRHLATMYSLGEGVEKDEERASYWFKREQENLDSEGQYKYGMFYYRDLQEIEEDPEARQQNLQTAFSWFEKAAVRGHGGAQKQLALMYYRGEVAEKDLNIALFWFERSAQQKDFEAALYAGLLNPPRDPHRARLWLELAVHAPDEDIAAQAREALEKLPAVAFL